MSATEFLKKLPSAVKSEELASLEGVVQLNISEPVWLAVRDGVFEMHHGVAEAPDVSLTMSDDNLVKLLKGELSGVMAYMSGKLQVDGDLMLAKQLPDLFDSRKLA